MNWQTKASPALIESSEKSDEFNRPLRNEADPLWYHRSTWAMHNWARRDAGWYVRGATYIQRALIIKAPRSRSLELFLKNCWWYIVCWRAVLARLLPVVELFQLISNWHAHRWRNFSCFQRETKDRLEQEPNGKNKQDYAGFCLYSVNRVDPSLALRIFSTNRTELRKALKKRDVSAARCFNFPFGSSGKSTGQSSFPIINETLKKKPSLFVQPVLCFFNSRKKK